jgi:NAD+ synthase
MRPMQKEIMETLHVHPHIVPEEEVRKRIDFIKTYILRAGAEGLVLGLSLGQDSTLAGKLSQMAVNELNEDYHGGFTFIGVRLPYGKQKDDDDAETVLNFINPDVNYVFDIKSTVDQFKATYDSLVARPLGDFQKGNVKARVRMVTQYALAGESNFLVVGTDHAAEAVTGFYTKFGDGACDLLPLTGLTKRQGKALLKYLNCPEQLYLKTPTADLLDEKPLQADETELGLTYDEIDDYLEGKEVSEEVATKIEKQYSKTRHKREMPVSMFDNGWQ